MKLTADISPKSSVFREFGVVLGVVEDVYMVKKPCK